MAISKVDSMAATILYQSLETNGAVGAMRTQLSETRQDLDRIHSTTGDVHQEVLTLQTQTSQLHSEIRAVSKRVLYNPSVRPYFHFSCRTI